MPEDMNPDKDMEKLSRAIVNAIMKSRDVRKAISKLSETEDICSKSFMVLMLKIGNLAEAMGLDVPEVCEHSAAGGEEPGDTTGDEEPKPDFKHIVDGRRLTRAELEFKEYLASRFNEKKWLEDNGLIY